MAHIVVLNKNEKEYIRAVMQKTIDSYKYCFGDADTSITLRILRDSIEINTCKELDRGDD